MPTLFVRPLAAARGLLRALQPTDGDDAAEVERWRTGFVVRILSGIGSVFLLGLAADNLATGRYWIGVTDLVLAAIAIANLFYLHRTGGHRSAQLVVSALLIYLFLWLLVGGGVEGTGPLWCYVFVAMLMFVHGLREGALVVGTLVVASAVLLLVPLPGDWMATYRPAFVERFLASLVALFIMLLLFEYARENTQDRISRMSARLHEAANTDALTGLSNRRHMIERVAAEHDRMQRGDAEGYTLIEADLDGFKRINDRHGHAAGDRLLTHIGDRLARGIREQDVLARWGGEEFLVLLPATTIDDATAVAERLRELVARDPVTVAGQQVALTISLGLARAEPGDSMDSVLHRTDRRMYAAKGLGRNTVVGNDNDWAAG